MAHNGTRKQLHKCILNNEISFLGKIVHKLLFWNQISNNKIVGQFWKFRFRKYDVP